MKTLVINLARSPDRWEAFLANNGAQLSQIERIEAVDGQTLGNKWDHLSRWAHLTYEPARFNIMAALGCFLSHKKCWQHIVDNDLPYALVLEDDVEVSTDTEEFIAAYEANPAPFDWIKLRNNQAHLDQRHKPVGAAINGNQLCVDMVGSKAANAYILTNAGARKLVQVNKLLAPVDHLEWFARNQDLTFVQAKSNVVDRGEKFESTITVNPKPPILRLPALIRIELVRMLVGRLALRKNLQRARLMAKTFQGARS